MMLNKNNKIVILGAGGHSKSIADTIERQGKYQIAGYVVNEKSENINGYSIIGKDEDLKEIYQIGIRYAAIGIGYIGKNDVREKLYKRLIEIGYSLPVICDPSAIISDKSKILAGTFVGKGVVINSGVEIGKACIINTRAVIEHDCKVEDFSHIAVGAVLCGNIHVGKGVFIGANTTIIQGKSIGNQCIIGAGEVIKQDVKADRLWVDNGEKMKKL